MKDVQCYELFGGIALKNHAFSFSFCFIHSMRHTCLNTTLFVFLQEVLFHFILSSVSDKINAMQNHACDSYADNYMLKVIISCAATLNCSQIY